jgi:hypothetical protein
MFNFCSKLIFYEKSETKFNFSLIKIKKTPHFSLLDANNNADFLFE